MKTVSRVLNGEPGVLDSTAERVQEAIYALGFRRNELARTLRRRGGAEAIGLLIEDVANPFYASIARGVEEVARQHGMLVMVASSDEDPQRERQLALAFVERRCRALLIVPAGDDHRYLGRELEHGTPIVFLDRGPGHLPADQVLIDNVAGGRLATEHLLRHGHTRIAFVGDPASVQTSAERLDGFRAAFAAAGVAVDESLVRADSHDVASAEAAVRDLLAGPGPPTAVFTANNRNSLGAIRAIHARHDRRVALVGFDDFELAELVSPAVTVVAHDPVEMGRQAARLATRRLAGVHEPPQRVVLPIALIERGSGELGPMSPPVPTLLPPNQLERFYAGGAGIAALRGTPAPSDRAPEEWIASTTTLFGEATAGLSALPDRTLLRDAIAADPVAWLGPEHVARYGADTRLLVKLLDAGERLPVHAHPSRRWARDHLGCPYGKTEAWIIVETRVDDASVFLGFNHDVDAAWLRALVDAQDRPGLLGALNRVPVGAGDAVLVPAGLPHAIGEGVLLVELQEPSDLSVLMEWDGFAVDGRVAGHLGLGYDVALTCVDCSGQGPDALERLRTRPPAPPDAAVFGPAADPYFRAERVRTGTGVELDAGFCVLVVLAGNGAVGPLRVRRGDCVVVPFSAGPVAVRGPLDAVRCRPPAPDAPEDDGG